MNRLEAAEMRFLRSVKSYTKLVKMRSEVTTKELEISGRQDVRSKCKQNWINHILFIHQQLHFLLNLETFKFTLEYT